MRDITLGPTFYQYFTTRAFATGIPGTLGGSPVISAYEDNNDTQITAGVSLSVDFDSVTGLNLITVVAISGNGFENGKSYALVITTGTVDSVSVVGEVVGEFTIGQSAAVQKLGYIGPRGLGVWLDDGASNTNTVLGTDGTENNPVSTIAAATTLATALGSQRFYLINGTQITLDQGYEGYDFKGIGLMNQVDLDSQDVDMSHFENLILTGTQGGSQYIHAEQCQLQALLNAKIAARFCDITGDITLRVATNQTFDFCSSATPGGGTPDLIFPGAGGATLVNWRHYSGGLTVKDARLNDVMSYETDGQLIIDSSCTSLEIWIRGMVNPITDNGTTSIIRREAAYDEAAIARRVNPQVNTALPNVTFEMYDSTNHNPATGLTVTGERSLDGGAYGAVSGSIAEISDGTYQFDADAADINGALVVWKFSASGADDTFVHVKTAA